MNKNNLSYKSNANSFLVKKEFKNMGYFIICLFSLFVIVFLILSITDVGYEPNIAYLVNKKIILSIILSGFGLGVSSFIVQSISKNKLADTSVLGISSVNLLVVTFMVFPLDIANNNAINNFNNLLPIAFVGSSIISSIVIFLLSSKKNFKLSKKFILAGILLNFVFTAFSSTLQQIMNTTKEQILSKYLNGNIEKPTGDNFIPFAIITSFVTTLWLLFLIKKFKIVCINPLIASQLSINVRSIYLQTLIIAGIFTGISFLLTGNIVFLGLLAANLSFSIFKINYKYSSLCSGIFGAIILGITYFINRNIINNSPVNTSYLIPLISCPYFLFLILKK